MSFGIDYDGDLNETAMKIEKAIRYFVRDLSADLEGNLARKANVDQGNLMGSWDRRFVDAYSYQITSSAKYALAVSEGWDPFTIYPKNKEVLAFNVGGNTVFADKVEHPGYEGSNYIPKSINQTMDRVDYFIDKALKEAGMWG